jgi:hypothetical protein
MYTRREPEVRIGISDQTRQTPKALPRTGATISYRSALTPAVGAADGKSTGRPKFAVRPSEASSKRLMGTLSTRKP